MCRIVCTLVVACSPVGMSAVCIACVPVMNVVWSMCKQLCSCCACVCVWGDVCIPGVSDVCLTGQSMCCHI